MTSSIFAFLIHIFFYSPLYYKFNSFHNKADHTKCLFCPYGPKHRVWNKLVQYKPLTIQTNHMYH